MDSIFIMMNHTWSAIGESCLYNLLRRPQSSWEILQERERLISYFQTHEKERGTDFPALRGNRKDRTIFDL